MSCGVVVLESMWRALNLQLPMSRRSQYARFFAVPQDMGATGRASLFRAMARTFIEAGYVDVQKDARRDPVELIACGIDVALHVYDRLAATCREELLNPVAADIAVRSAAFEALFQLNGRVRNVPWDKALASLRWDVATFHAVRFEAAAHLASIRVDRRALLAEVVVLGSAAPLLHRDAGLADALDAALPFARVVVHASRGRFREALAIVEQIFTRVPGHGLALEQAVRCCRALGLVDEAEKYSKKSSRLGHPAGARARTSRSRVGLASSRVEIERVRRDAERSEAGCGSLTTDVNARDGEPWSSRAREIA